MDTLPLSCTVTGARALSPVARQCHVRGFTLIELLVVMVITGILLAAAVPMFDTFMANTARDASVSTLASAIREAKALARERGQPVTLCPSNNAESAEATCLAAADAQKGWATGWLAYVGFEPPAGEEDTNLIVLRQGPIENVEAIAPAVPGYKLTYLATGVALGDMGSFTIVPKGQDLASDSTVQLCINSTGSARKASKCTPKK